MKFSIFVWTRDTMRDFFRECLTSLAEQTYDDFEVYILDENRDDRVSRLCAELFPRDPRMIYHRQKNARGPAYAFNAALHRAAGDYVLFMGQHRSEERRVGIDVSRLCHLRQRRADRHRQDESPV